MEQEVTLQLTSPHLQEVVAILRKNLPVGAKAWAFGSRISNKVHRGSDLDLAIDANRKLTIEEVIALEVAFEESDLPFRVDIVDLNQVTPTFKEIIEVNKIEIYPGS